MPAARNCLRPVPSHAAPLSTLFPRPLDTHQVMFAMGEAIAHLNHLEHKGEVRKVEGIDGIVRFVKSN